MKAWRLGVLVALVLGTSTGFANEEDDAWRRAEQARRLFETEDFADAAKAWERYIKEHPKGKDFFHAHVGVFDGWLKAGKEDRAKKAGKRVFKRYPKAKGTFPVVAAWLEQGPPSAVVEGLHAEELPYEQHDGFATA